MLFYKGKRILEGIDGIDLMIKPELYDYLNPAKQLDPHNKLSIVTNTAKIPNEFYEIDDKIICIYADKDYHYLHISGEYINPELPIKESIVDAIYMLFDKGLLGLHDFKNHRRLSRISKDFIRAKLYTVISKVAGIEFCFDFLPETIEISKNVMILKKSDDMYRSFIKTKLKERPPCLINEDDTTYYSNDYKEKGRRKSTLKLYDREKWLLKKGNEYSADFIRNNPYKKRIEFVLKASKNTSYLTIDNLDGTYDQIIERFTPYLAKLYKKYFFWKVFVNDTSEHPYFSMIYNWAHSDIIKSNKSLESVNSSKPKYKRYAERTYGELLTELEKEERRHNKLLMKDIPNSYYANNMDLTKLVGINPFTPNDDLIDDISDDEFKFNKGDWQYPTYKTIDDNDN